jgi:hypothetical protein
MPSMSSRRLAIRAAQDEESSEGPTKGLADRPLPVVTARVKDRNGIPVTVQIEKAVREWLESWKDGVVVRTERKRASTRKRP